MAKLPNEPDRDKLVAVGPEVSVLRKGTKLWRIYSRRGKYPSQWNDFRYFGPVLRNRFDPHTAPPEIQERGIIYLAESGVTCFAECFQERRTIDISKDEPWLVGFRLERDVALHDLRGPWPIKVGGSTKINSGPKDAARNWSRAIYEIFGTIEGLHYLSSMHGGKPAIALYQRARDALPKDPQFHRALNDPSIQAIVKNAARELWYVIVDGKDFIWSPWPKKR